MSHSATLCGLLVSHSTMLNRKSCPNCNASLVVESRWLGLVKSYGDSCPNCGVRIAYDTAGGVYLIVGNHSTEDPAVAAELARQEGIAWPPSEPK